MIRLTACIVCCTLAIGIVAAGSEPKITTEVVTIAGVSGGLVVNHTNNDKWLHLLVFEKHMIRSAGIRLRRKALDNLIDALDGAETILMNDKGDSSSKKRTEIIAAEDRQRNELRLAHHSGSEYISIHVHDEHAIASASVSLDQANLTKLLDALDGAASLIGK